MGPQGKLWRELIVEPLLTQKRRLWGMAAGLAFLSLFNGLVLLVIKVFFKALFSPGGAAPHLAELVPDSVRPYLGALGAAVVEHKDLATFVPLVLLAAGVCRGLATYLYQLNQQAVVLYVFKSYRERLFAAILALPYAEVRKRQTGEWMSIVMNDVLFLQNRFADVAQGILQGGVSVVSGLTVLAIIHWPSALALLALAPVVAFGMGRTGKRIARYAEAFQREMANIAGAVLDFRARFDFIRAQGGEERETARFKVISLAYYRMIRRSIMIRSAFAPALEFFGFGVFAGFIYLVGHGMLTGMTPDRLLTFLGALGVLLRPLRDLGEQLSRYHETRGTLQNSLVLFDSLLQRFSPSFNPAALASPAAPQDSKKDRISEPLNGRIFFRRLRAGMAKDVRFSGDDLEVAPGQAIAIVGPSGAGKSTFLKTLAGLVAPIEWDGDPTWDQVAADSSMVSQDPFLFDDTIAENLVYGLADRPPDASLWKALATVNIDAEIKALPDGLTTRLRAIGSNVSGGQLQRLVIARSLLRGKFLWLLDEATSAVDPKSEKDITLRLIDACRTERRALLAVTHRLTWLEAFDTVWFVEDGRVRLAGPHATLLAERRYREYCAAAGAHGGGPDG